MATFVRPETSGLPGFLFAVLGGFDKPFNQAPSLHIALLVILWDHWRQRLNGVWRGIVWHAWFFLIGASVLTTWQHHFIDIPTGALLGLFALWLFPAKGDLPFAGFRLTTDPKARRLARFYALGAALALAGAAAGAFALRRLAHPAVAGAGAGHRRLRLCRGRPTRVPEGGRRQRVAGQPHLAPALPARRQDQSMGVDAQAAAASGDH